MRATTILLNARYGQNSDEFTNDCIPLHCGASVVIYYL